MHRPALFLTALAVALPALYECATLSALTPNVCGNGVIDPGEDCDGLVDSAAHEACGAPSEGAFACRFTCKGSAACPASFDCGGDEICRQPSGRFEPLGSPLPVGGETVTLADFNGDGYADALTVGPPTGAGAARVQVSYLTASGGLLDTFIIADRLTSPSVGDVNNDGFADLTATLRFTSGSGIEVFLGQSATSLVAQTFAAATVPPGISQVRILPIAGLGAVPRIVYFATGSDAYQTGLYLPTLNLLPDIASPSELTVLPLPQGPDVLVGQVVMTQVLATPEPCPALVYAVRQQQLGSGDLVQVLTGLCRIRAEGAVDFATNVTTTTLTLPRNLCSKLGEASGDDCGPGAVVGDVNGDGYADIVVSLYNPSSAAGPYETYVAYGDGQGGFAPGPNGASNTVAPLQISLIGNNGAIVNTDGVPTLTTFGSTLAVGDINGDHMVDFISTVPTYPNGNGPPVGSSVTMLLSRVVSSDSGPSSVEYTTPLGAASWRTAGFGDFDGDGRLDLVGGSQTSGLDFFGTAFDSSGNYIPEHFFVPTSGGTNEFAVGDIDGDGISDLAFEQNDPAGDGSVDLEVAYGATDGPLASPLFLARYASIAQIVTPVPYTELDVVASSSSSAAPSILRFTTNSGGRPPLATAALTALDAGAVNDSGIAIETAVASHPGMFTLSDGGTRGVAAVGRNGQAEGSTSSLWFFPTQASQGTLAVDAPSVGPLIPGFDPDPEATTASGQAVLLAAAPLGVGGPSSLVAVSTVPDGGGQAEVIIASLTGTPLSFAAQNLTGSNVPPLLPNLPLIVDAGPEASAPLRTTVAEDGQLALTDVDGDGYADMILLTGGTVTCPASNASRSVVVFWNDHQGGFGPAQVLAQCYLTRCGAFGDAGSPTLTCPRAFATLAAAPTGAPTIAYVTGSSLGFTQFGAAASGQARPLLPAVGPADAGDAAPAPNPFAALPSGITGIASGDINGDGVPDLAILAHGTLYLFQGVPVNK